MNLFSGSRLLPALPCSIISDPLIQKERMHYVSGIFIYENEEVEESPMNPDIHGIGLLFLIRSGGPSYPHGIPVLDLPFHYRIMLFPVYCIQMMATDMQYPRESLHMRAHGIQALDMPSCIQQLSIPHPSQHKD